MTLAYNEVLWIMWRTKAPTLVPSNLFPIEFYSRVLQKDYFQVLLLSEQNVVLSLKINPIKKKLQLVLLQSTFFCLFTIDICNQKRQEQDNQLPYVHHPAASLDNTWKALLKCLHISNLGIFIKYVH